MAVLATARMGDTVTSAPRAQDASQRSAVVAFHENLRRGGCPRGSSAPRYVP